MGLFNRNFDRPGPGVSKDAPRKKGAARFFELLGRDFGSFFKANFLCVAGFVPWALLTGIGVVGQSMPFTLVGGLLGGVIAAPALAGMQDTVLRALRDEPGYWWHVYKKAFRNNWRASLVPGAIMGLLTAMQLFMVWAVFVGGVTLDLVSSVLMCLNVLLTGMCLPFVFGQLVLMDLPLAQLLKNSLFLALANVLWAVALALVQLVYWLAMLFLFPLSLPWVLLVGFIPVTMICQMVVFRILDKAFDLEAQFVRRREEQLQSETDQ